MNKYKNCNVFHYRTSKKSPIGIGSQTIHVGEWVWLFQRIAIDSKWQIQTAGFFEAEQAIRKFLQTYFWL